jgi:hypothetical protein
VSIKEKARKGNAKLKKRGRPPGSAAGKYRRPLERGLGPEGGGWNIAQSSAWSGIGESSLREIIRRKLAGEDFACFPFYMIGRRILIPREGFRRWYNETGGMVARR